MNNRFEYIDNIKAIAVLMVVFLHSYSVLCYQFGEISNFDFSLAVFYGSVSRPCVPLFLMASGVTLLNKDYDLKPWLIDKIVVRLLLPFLFYWLVYCKVNHQKFINPFDLLSICYHFGFVGTILTCYILYPLLRPWIKNSNNKQAFYFSAFWFVSLILHAFYPKFTLFSTDFIYMFIGYPILGYFLSKFDTKKLKRWMLLVYLFMSLITFILIYFCTHKIQALDELYFGYLMPNVILMSLSLFLFVKDINFEIKNSFASKVRNFLSEHSYGIYFLHPLYLSLFYDLHKTLPIIISGWIIFFIGLICTVLTMFIVLKITEIIPFLNKISIKLVG